MINLIKWLAIGSVVVILGLVVTVRVIGWNWARNLVEQQITVAAGREFTIAGDLDVDVSLKPFIRVEKIRLANAPWGRFANMAEIGVLALRIDLVELMQGRIVIPELRMRAPVVHLAVSRQGKPNWRLGSKSPPQTAQESEQKMPLPVIHRVVIQAGKIRYRDLSQGTNYRLAVARLHGYTDPARNEIALGGEGRLGGQPWRVAARAGSYRALRAGQKPYPVDIALALADTRANVQGALTNPLRLQGADLSVSVEGLNLSMLSPLIAGARPQLPRHTFKGHLIHAGDTWRMRNFQASVGRSELHGELALDTRGARPSITADLTSSVLRYADFAKLAPPTEDKKPQPLDLGAMGAVDAVVDFRGDEVLTPVAAMRDTRLAARLEQGRLAVEPLRFDIGGGRVHAEATIDASPRPFEAYLEANVEHVRLNKVGTRAAAIDELKGLLDGRISARATGANKAQMASAAPGDPLAFLESLIVADSRVSYRIPGSDSRLRVAVDSKMIQGRRQLQLEGGGIWRGQAFEIALRSDPLLELGNLRKNRAYAIAGTVSGAGHEARLDGTLEQPLRLQGIDVAVSVSGAGMDRLSAALGSSLPDLAPYEVEGRLIHQSTRWRIADLEGRVGESDFAGDIALDVAEKPHVHADLFSRMLRWADFAPLSNSADDAHTGARRANAQTKSQGAHSPLDFKALGTLDADIHVEAEEIVAARVPVDDLTADLALRGGRLTIDPFELAVGDGMMRGTLALKDTRPVSGAMTLDVARLDMQKIVDLPSFTVGSGVVGGHAEASFIGATAKQIAADEQTLFDTIYSFTIEDTHFTYREPASRTDLKIKVATTTTKNGSEPLRARSVGRYRGQSFVLDIDAGSPLRLFEQHKAYPLDARFEVGKTEAHVEGVITQPLKLEGLNLSLSLKGPNPSRLQDFIGVPLPSLPPYEVEGELSRDGSIWRYEDFQGTAGDSDLAGALSIDMLRAPRPLIVANLVSRKLDLDDLAGLIGAPPDAAPGETASAQQKAEAATAASDPKVLPADPVDLTALLAVDARVRYMGKRVITPLPIDDVRIRARLADGHLKLMPINFGVGGGNITTRLVVDASERPVVAELRTKIDQVDLKEILRRFAIADASVGDIGGRARLVAMGDSVAELAATLKGRLSLIMAGGRIDSLLVQLAGIDFTESIAALVGSDEAVPIRCAFTDFRARNGQVDVLTMLVDTADTRFSGDGAMNLDEERLDLVVTPDPKDFSLFAFPTPLHIKGLFSNLTVYPEYSELLAQTTVTVLLGLVATPFAALIPLIETGTGADAACKALLDAARRERRAASREDEEQPPKPKVQFMRQGQ